MSQTTDAVITAVTDLQAERDELRDLCGLVADGVISAMFDTAIVEIPADALARIRELSRRS